MIISPIFLPEASSVSPEHALRAWIPIDDLTGPVDYDDRTERGAQHGPHTRFAVSDGAILLLDLREHLIEVSVSNPSSSPPIRGARTE